MKCMKCNESLNPHWKVCPACTAPVKQTTTCLTCGAELKKHWVKCPICQKSIVQQFDDHSDSDIENFNSVTIGNQIWMLGNLNVSKFRNGEIIQEAIFDEDWKRLGEESKPAWCHYDNDPNKGKVFGKLYNWYAVIDSRGLAPKGWHIPTDDEWRILTEYLGGEELAVKQIMTGRVFPEAILRTLPGGFRNVGGNFTFIDQQAQWWSSTEASLSKAYFRYINRLSFKSKFNGLTHSKAVGRSILCVKD